MLKELKSVLKNPKGSVLPLAFKAIVFSFFLFLSGTHWFFTLLFIAAAFYLYFIPSLNASQFIFSFLILLVSSLAVVSSVSHWSLIVSLSFGLLFFLLLGIKNLVFSKRQSLYYLFYSLLILAIFIFFFWFESSRLFFIRYLLVFFALAFLSREFLSFLVEDFSSHPKRNLTVYGTSFLAVQLVWAVSFLPISFLNEASLALLIVLILQDFVIHHFSGAMSRKVVLRNITAFLILSLIIFSASKWTL